MNFFDKKLKVGLSVFFLMVLVILEFGILDGFLFTANPELNYLSVQFKSITKSLGYNFCVMSIIVYVITLIAIGYLGYRKNWAGLIGIELIAICPIIGYLCGVSHPGAYNVLFGWGLAHLTPMFTLFKLHTFDKRGVVFLLAIAVFVLYAVVWYVFRLIRKNYDAKNPW